jgi:succinate dehydrogenase flavin-adding protein (antitoxin of CptAB toxin-antitoxin module)
LTTHNRIYSFSSLAFLIKDLTLTNQRSYSMSRIDQMKSLLEELEPDMVKFYEKGNKAAGTRARKTLQEIKKVSQEIRLEIQDMKNSGQV